MTLITPCGIDGGSLCEVDVGIMLLRAFRADPVADVGLGMAVDIDIHRFPAALGGSDSFAIGANRQDALQGFVLRESGLEVGDEFLTLLLGLLALGDVPADAKDASMPWLQLV
jgi:hypothetical protein